MTADIHTIHQDQQAKIKHLEARVQELEKQVKNHGALNQLMIDIDQAMDAYCEKTLRAAPLS